MAGTIVYDSTGETPAGADKSAEAGNRAGFSFTTGSSFPGKLSDVKIDLGDATPSDGGTVTVYLYSDTGGSGPGTLLATIGSLSDSSLSSSATLADFAISSTINLSADTRYWIVVADSSKSDAFIEYGANGSGTGVGNEYYWDGGSPNANSTGADIGQVTETLNSSDQVPVVTTSSGATAFVAGAGPVPVDNAINVTDADNATLASAKVSITGNFQSGQDVLAFANTSASSFGNIAGAYNSSTGVLTLTSAGDTATVQQFKAALEAVTYTDTAATPDSLTRTLSFVADDGIGNSIAATKLLTVADSADSHLLYDNTIEAAGGTDTSFEKGAYVSAFSFTTTVGAAGTLGDVKIDLGDATPSDGGSVTAYLYSDTGGSGPGTLQATIGSISDSSLSATANYVDFKISSTINVSADTEYWIEFADSSKSSAFLAFENGDAGTGVAGGSYLYKGTVYPNAGTGGDAGSADLAQVTEDTASVDQPPVVTTSSGATAFVAGAGPVPVDSAVNVSDADNSTLASATVSITGNFQSGQDVLSFNNTSSSSFGNIGGSYNSGAGVLTLSSAGDTATVQQFKAALEAVTYTDTAATPDTLTRTLSFVADDGIAHSAVATKQITVAGSAQSRLVYDNTAEPVKSTDTSFEDGAYNSAFSFTSVAGSAGTLADVKVDLGDATPGDGGTITAYLYSDTGGSGPGSQLATIGSISDSSLGTTASYADFKISSTIDLNADTRYWIQLTDSSTSGAFLAFEDDDAGTGVAGESNTFKGAIEPNSGGANLAQVTETVCFASGARILTNRGEVAVEDLAIGDMAVTASGQARPIKWIGHRKVDCRDHVDQRSLRPVRIAADAFGPGKPNRDLLLSPDHAVCVDLLGEVLILTSALVDGGAVAQVETDEVTYWHIELDSHDILLANGLPAESYMDCGNRTWFTAAEGDVDPEQSVGSLDIYCRPFFNSGAVVEACRSQLGRRAEALGWRKTLDMDMHLSIDGRRIDPLIDEDVACFHIPEGSIDVELKSETFVPAWRGESDGRRLGVRVLDLHVSDGFGVDTDIALDHLLLGDGLHELESDEQQVWRWTNGRCRLSPELWTECRGDVILRVRIASNSSGYRWVAPGASAETALGEPRNVVRLRAA